MITPQWSYLDFFAGGGMAGKGLGDQWRCLFANDIDPKKARSYEANFPGERVKVCDVADLTPANLPTVHLAFASFPCVDVSEAGAGAALKGWRSAAIFPCLDLLASLPAGCRPKIIALENVTGLFGKRSREFFDAICDRLTAMGYRCGAVVVHAANFTPQSRERVFIVAVDEALDIPASIIADRPSSPFHTKPLVEALRRQPTLQPIWWRLPVPPPREAMLADILEEDPRVPWDAKAVTDRIIAKMAPRHLAKLDDAKRAGGRVVRGLFQRRRPNGAGDAKVSRWEVRDDHIAGCLRTGGGGSSIQRILIIDGALVRTRRLTPRECARLMGLPDSYRLPANTIEGYNLTGDGVAVPVVRWLAAHVLEPLLQASASTEEVAE
jgi:DNA (cytosine-5)-methyltransferase 1